MPEDRRQALFGNLGILKTLEDDIVLNGNFTTGLTIKVGKIPILFKTFENTRAFSCFKHEIFDPKRGPSTDPTTNKVIASFGSLITDDGYSRKKDTDEDRLIKL
jgi:hypothetical protein